MLFSMAMQLNEYGAEMVKQHPGRFGFFATLPMPGKAPDHSRLGYLAPPCC